MARKASFGFSFTAGKDKDDDDDESSSLLSSSYKGKSSSSSVTANLIKPSLLSKKKDKTEFQNFIKELAENLDNRNKHSEDFNLPRTSQIDYNDTVHDLQTCQCTIEQLERKLNNRDVCDVRCNSDEVIIKSIRNQKKKQARYIVSYIDKGCDNFDTLGGNYRTRLCRTLSKIQKYGCKGLMSPALLLSDNLITEDIITRLNEQRVFEQGNESDTFSVSLFDGKCCENDYSQERNMCDDKCTTTRESLLNNVIRDMKLKHLDLDSMTCRNWLKIC